MDMICDKCLNPMKDFGWHNNQRLCRKCLHSMQPRKKVCSMDSCETPTIKDLMEKWNR